jgi:uncharacterized membrane protein
MYDILIPINKLSIRDRKIIEIVNNERETLKHQKYKYTNNDTQYNYYITRQYQNKNVGCTAKPININKKRLLKNMRYTGFNFKDINKDGKIIIDFK